MPEPIKDVNTTKTGSSPASTQQTAETKTAATVADVKTSGFDANADKLIDALIEGASTDEAAAGDVLNKNKTSETEEKKEVETEEKVEKTDEVVDDKADVKPKDEESTELAEEETTESKHEEAIPYERFKEVNDKVVTLEPLAQAHQTLLTFCHTNNITVEQFQEHCELMRLENTDPQAALKRLTEKVNGLKVQSGQGLPDDLQAELNAAKVLVESGEMPEAQYKLSEKRAKEIAELRLKHNGLEKQNRFSAMQQQQQQNAALFQSLSNWSNNIQKNDPDFSPKKSLTAPDGMFEDFLANFAFVNMQKPPNSVKEYTDNAEVAYKKVKDMAKRYQPKPAAKRVLTSTGSTSKSTSNGEAKNMDDVVAQVAKKHGY